jgi:membrane associated rhomboid family serine protease
MALLVVLGLVLVVYRATTATERARLAAAANTQLQRALLAFDDWHTSHAAFFDGLRARKRVAWVTRTLVVVNTVMFALVALASGFGHRDVLIEWGASVGLRTTNGEWWRLLTSLVVHGGFVQLLTCLVALLSLGLVLERIVGSVALLCVYAIAGIFSGLAVVSAYPMHVSAGASGSIAGLYGLAGATAVWGLSQQPQLRVPWGVLKWLLAAALVFFGHGALSGMVMIEAELTGFVAGALCGIVLGRGVSRQPIPFRRSMAVAAATCALALAVAVPLQGTTNVRPDVERMLETDEHTAAAFRSAATQLALGRTSEKAMIALIEGEIVPALQAEQSRLLPRGRVLDEQQEIMTAARAYVQLRIDGWELRAAAFRKGSLAMLRQADSREGAARDFLARHPALALK